jgi:predicted GIY-YIG superfamily endonuclease
MDTVFIYSLSDSFGVKYIGKTNNLKQRLYRHIFDAKTKKN